MPIGLSNQFRFLFPLFSPPNLPPLSPNLHPSHSPPHEPTTDPPEILINPSPEKDPRFSPFAGEVTCCPDRFLAKMMTMPVMAFVLRQVDVSVVGGEKKLPMLDYVSPALGITRPVEGIGLRVRVVRKERWFLGEGGR